MILLNKVGDDLGTSFQAAVGGRLEESSSVLKMWILPRKLPGWGGQKQPEARKKRGRVVPRQSLD